jgi:hypothetical protein
MKGLTDERSHRHGADGHRHVDRGHDDEALEKAMQLQGELRVELWCGTRKVADVPNA